MGSGHMCRCGKFQDVSDFDGNNRSCRDRLLRHYACRQAPAAAWCWLLPQWRMLLQPGPRGHRSQVCCLRYAPSRPPGQLSKQRRCAGRLRHRNARLKRAAAQSSSLSTSTQPMSGSGSGSGPGSGSGQSSGDEKMQSLNGAAAASSRGASLCPGAARAAQSSSVPDPGLALAWLPDLLEAALASSPPSISACARTDGLEAGTPALAAGSPAAYGRAAPAPSPPFLRPRPQQPQPQAAASEVPGRGGACGGAGSGIEGQLLMASAPAAAAPEQPQSAIPSIVLGHAMSQELQVRGGVGWRRWHGYASYIAYLCARRVNAGMQLSREGMSRELGK